MNTTSDLGPCLETPPDNLFSHPGFRPILIDDNGMSLKGPFNEARVDIPEGKDISLRQDIIEKGYRCISHFRDLVPNNAKCNEIHYMGRYCTSV
jgi:hypothetical protein